MIPSKAFTAHLPCVQVPGEYGSDRGENRKALRSLCAVQALPRPGIKTRTRMNADFCLQAHRERATRLKISALAAKISLCSAVQVLSHWGAKTPKALSLKTW